MRRGRQAFAAACTLVLAFAAPANAAAPAATTGWRQVTAGVATVLVPEAGLVPWAHEVAPRADRAVRLAAAFWEVPAPRVRVVIDARDDVFNAWVDPLGAPVIHLRSRNPQPGEVGFAARDPLLLLLVHEAIHAVHFGGRPGSLPARTRIVGADLPWPPPSWLLEGVAVWAESRLPAGGGGRLDDADVRAVLRLLAVEGPWPSLEDASLVTHRAWPAGEVRYLAGGAFVDLLVRRHGVATFRAALRRYETQAPWLGFAHAWHRETGGDLRAEWAALRRSLIREAVDRADAAGATRGDAAGDGAVDGARRFADGRAPALSPDGRRLAWLAEGGVRVAEVTALRRGVAADARSAPASPRAHPLAIAPERLTWWTAERLVYARVDPTPRGRLRELVALDLTTGRERVLSDGARAFHPVPTPDGCLAFVRDTAEAGSELRRWCDGGAEAGVPEWRPPRGTRIVGLAASPAGRLAAVLWAAGATRLVELRPAGEGWAARPLPAPPGSLRDPVWDGEDALLIASDGAGGTFESWRVDLSTGRPERLSATFGGVIGHAPGVVAVRRSGAPALTWTAGPVAATPSAGAAAAAPETGNAPPEPAAPPPASGTPSLDLRLGEILASPPAEVGDEGPYTPLGGLRALGWLPAAPGPAELGVTVLAADPTRSVGLTASAGVAWRASPGPLGPVWAGVALHLDDLDPFPAPRRPAPLRATLRAGVLPYRPHLGTSTSLLPRVDLTLAPRLAVRPGVSVRLRLSGLLLPADGPRLGAALRVAAADGRVDPWGVPTRGWSVAASAVADPLPAGGGTSLGVWSDAAAWWPAAAPGDATLDAGARGGWRAPAPTPAGVWGDGAASATGGVGLTVPLAWRLGDGRWAWERLRVRPGVRVNLAHDAGRLRASAGAELRLAADLVAGYGAPLSVTLEAGGQWGGGRDGAWLRIGVPGVP